MGGGVAEQPRLQEKHRGAHLDGAWKLEGEGLWHSNGMGVITLSQQD